MSIYQFTNFHNFDIFKKLEGKCATQCGDDNGTISQLGRRILNVQATTTQKFHLGSAKYKYKHIRGQFGPRIGNISLFGSSKRSVGGRTSKYSCPKCILAGRYRS